MILQAKQREKVALLFPGQGSQIVGMGRELFDTFEEAKDIFLAADEELKQHLSKLMFFGDMEELTLTSNAQPALLIVSMAVMTVLAKQSNTAVENICIAMAGHSLGEYSALCAARAFSILDAVKLVRIRGNAMHNALPHGTGGMLALLGADDEQAVENLINQASNDGICQIANDNGAGQVVLSGDLNAINSALELATTFGIKKAIKLKVSAPFHSNLMKSAADVMRAALDEVKFSPTIVPVIANYTAAPYSETNLMRDLLVSQITGRVRWRETMLEFDKVHNVETYVEIGPGQVLGNIASRMVPKSRVFSLHTPQNIEEFLYYIEENGGKI